MIHGKTNAVHVPTEIINQSCEHLRFTFTKKNFTIAFTIIFHFFITYLEEKLGKALSRIPPSPPSYPKKENSSCDIISLVVIVIKEFIDCKLSNWNKSHFGALLPVPSCSIDHGAWEREEQVGWKQTVYMFMFQDIVTNCGHNKVFKAVN